MRNIPMELLRSFVTVVEMGGFTVAGQLLGKSQPAVSLQIKRLEELIDSQLFFRSGPQLELTLAGDRMLSYARQILALNDEALAELTQPTITGRIRFGIPSEFATTLLPKVLGRFSQAYPAVTLEIVSDLSEKLFSQHLQHYDLILGLQDAPSKSRASFISADDLVWVTSAAYDTHKQSPLPLIVAPAPCLYRSRALRTLKMSGRPWRIAYTNLDITGITSAIEEGLGVTVLARKTVPASLRVLPFSSNFPKLGQVGIHLVYKKEHASEALLKLVEYVSTVMA